VNVLGLVCLRFHLRMELE